MNAEPKTRVRRILEVTSVFVLAVVTLTLFMYFLFGRQRSSQSGLMPKPVYHAVIDQKEPITAGKSVPLTIQIFDQFGNPVTDLEARSFGRYYYFAYVAVAPRDLSSLQANPVVVDPYAFPINLGGMTGMGSRTPTSPQAMPQGEDSQMPVQDIKIQAVMMFPKDGQYIVFVDVLPRGGSFVTLAVPVDVGSAKTQAATLTSDTTLTQPSGDLTITLKYEGTLKAGQPANINFEVMDAQGKMISNDIGVMSGNHCALYVVDEGLTTFIRPNLVDPSNLQFWVNFPKPGKYKVWLEYNYADQPWQTAFVLDVK